MQPKKINTRKIFREVDGLTLEPVGVGYMAIISAELVHCDKNSFVIKVTDGFDEIMRNDRFNVKFGMNSLTFMSMHNSLKWFKEHKLHRILVDNPVLNNISSIKPSSDFRFNCELPKSLNEEQKLAIKYMIDAYCHPLPYVLHGPPGTGKTRTLVEAISELVRTTTDNILVTAHSNSACDEIATRLLKVLAPGKLLRIYAKSFDKERVPSSIHPYCNWHDNEFQFPALDYLYQFRVVVTTILSAGTLSRARDNDSNFDSGHFKRVFIDEAGSIQEVVSMIPIAGKYSFLLLSFITHYSS